MNEKCAARGTLLAQCWGFARLHWETLSLPSRGVHFRLVRGGRPVGRSLLPPILPSRCVPGWPRPPGTVSSRPDRHRDDAGHCPQQRGAPRGRDHGLRRINRPFQDWLETEPRGQRFFLWQQQQHRDHVHYSSFCVSAVQLYLGLCL